MLANHIDPLPLPSRCPTPIHVDLLMCTTSVDRLRMSDWGEMTGTLSSHPNQRSVSIIYAG